MTKSRVINPLNSADTIKRYSAADTLYNITAQLSLNMSLNSYCNLNGGPVPVRSKHVSE